MKTTTYFARFYAPGAFVAETWNEPISSPSPASVRWPERAYCYQVFEVQTIEQDGDTYIAKPKQIGPTYYHPDSRVMTLAELVSKNDPKHGILISNMQSNKWPAVIFTRWGAFPQPYDADEMEILESAK